MLPFPHALAGCSVHNAGMNVVYVRVALLILSIVCIAWGGMISFSQRFFSYWQDTHWKETNNNQWSDASRKANRLGVGLGAFMFGIALAELHDSTTVAGI